MYVAVIVIAVALIMGIIFFLSVKISVAVHKRRAIYEFRLKAYGVAMAVHNRTGCNYGELKNLMDDFVKHYDTKGTDFPYEEEAKKAFMSNQVRLFVYLCALNYVWQYDDDHIVKKNVGEYCVTPLLLEQSDFEWHLKNPFWAGGEAVLVGLSAASLIVFFLMFILSAFDLM